MYYCHVYRSKSCIEILQNRSTIISCQKLCQRFSGLSALCDTTQVHLVTSYTFADMLVAQHNAVPDFCTICNVSAVQKFTTPFYNFRVRLIKKPSSRRVLPAHCVAQHNAVPDFCTICNVSAVQKFTTPFYNFRVRLIKKPSSHRVLPAHCVTPSRPVTSYFCRHSVMIINMRMSIWIR